MNIDAQHNEVFSRPDQGKRLFLYWKKQEGFYCAREPIDDPVHEEFRCDTKQHSQRALELGQQGCLRSKPPCVD